MPYPNRRQFIAWAAAAASGALMPNLALGKTASTDLISKPIPSTGEPLVTIGMGTWQTFNVGSDRQLRDARCKVLDTFFQQGGRLVDSSPMYGSAQEVLGYCLKDSAYQNKVFAADKIWTFDGDATREQAGDITKLWGLPSLPLLQVHNLLSWEAHLETLFEMKASGKLRYVGITTSHGRRHDELEEIMKRHPLDFVQLTYNLKNRDVEQRLLPLASERGIAVIANRPFGGGPLIRSVQSKGVPVPKWAEDYQITNWPQFLLKFITSHPAVTCAIPATTQVVHMQENMGAARGELPRAQDRQKMIKALASL